jgi:predicted secreted hydrolase
VTSMWDCTSLTSATVAKRDKTNKAAVAGGSGARALRSIRVVALPNLLARRMPQMVLSLSLLILLVSGAPAANAQVTYPSVLPETELQFPRDEGSHPDYRIEWWYVTGWLDATAGSKRPPRGFQVTFFRVRPGIAEDNPSAFAPSQVLFAHAALADPAHGKLRHAERSARAGFDLVYAREGRLDVRLDDWSLRQTGEGRYRAVVNGDDFAFDVEFSTTQPTLLQGDDGFSRKGPDPRAASHYYSQPHLAVTGEVVVEGRRERVTGKAWLDHEWSSDYVDEQADGWDWMGINLNDGGALMAFRMRQTRETAGAATTTDGIRPAESVREPAVGDAIGTNDSQATRARWAGATLRSAAGEVETFAPDEVEWTPLAHWQSPRTGAIYPTKWRVRLGARTFIVEPVMNDAELDSRSSTGTIYWEGPVRLLSEPDGQELGRGYLELTGYAGRLDL